MALRRMEVENVILALEENCLTLTNGPVMSIAMLLASASDDNNDFRCSEHASLSVGGIIVGCWENIENIDAESIIYAHRGVEQEGTS